MQRVGEANPDLQVVRASRARGARAIVVGGLAPAEGRARSTGGIHRLELAGQTPVFHNVLPTVAPYIRAGTMRALSVAASKRTPYFPDVPTIAEAGYPGHEVGFWMGAFVPAGTANNVVEILNTQVARIMALPDVKERVATIGFDPTLSSSQELAAHMKAETDKW